MKKYAKLEWTASDVRFVAASKGQKMTIKQAEAWLSEHERRIRDRLCELGFEVIESLMGEKVVK